MTKKREISVHQAVVTSNMQIAWNGKNSMSTHTGLENIKSINGNSTCHSKDAKLFAAIMIREENFIILLLFH